MSGSIPEACHRSGASQLGRAPQKRQQRQRPQQAAALARQRTSSKKQAPARPHDLVVGIDLGTTNSAVAILKGKKPGAVALPGGGFTLPSVVYYSRDGQVYVGHEARRKAASEGQAPFSSVKRFMGRSYEACAEDRAQVPFGVRRAQGGGVGLLKPHAPPGTPLLRPQDVSAEVVRALLGAVAATTPRRATRAVISVPAYFDAAQRAATVEAGRLAGLETVQLIWEPVAAALGYGARPATGEATVLVLDLGGGTFDVSLLELGGGGAVEVLATGGDPHLGGDDVDQAIVQWLGREHLAGVDWRAPAALGTLTQVAQAAKVALSSAEAVKLTLPFKQQQQQRGSPSGGDGDARAPPRTVMLTRAVLDRLCTPLFSRMNRALDEACWQAEIDLGEAVAAERARVKRLRGKKGQQLGGHLRPRGGGPISEVLLVGGATRMPAFHTFVRNATNLTPKTHLVDPDLAVALGAAVRAGELEGRLEGVMVMDVWQASLMRALASDHLAKEKAAGRDTGGDAGPGKEGAPVAPENAGKAEVAPESAGKAEE